MPQVGGDLLPMADEPGQVPPADAPDAPANPPVDPNTPEPQDDPKEFTADYVKKLRAENADHRRKLRDTETRLKTLEDAQLSDAEKRDKRLKELEEENARLQGESRRSGLVAAAAKAGAVDPEDVAALVPSDVLPADFDRALKDLKQRKTYLFNRPGAGTADGGAGGEPPKGRNMNDLIRQASGR